MCAALISRGAFYRRVVFAALLALPLLVAAQEDEEEEEDEPKDPPLPKEVAELVRRYSAVSEWRGYFEASETGDVSWTTAISNGSRRDATTSHGQFRIKRNKDGWEPGRGMLAWGAANTVTTGDATAVEERDYSHWEKFGNGEEFHTRKAGSMPTFGAEFSMWLLKKSVWVRVGSATTSAPKLAFETTGRRVSQQSRGDGQRALVTTPLNRTEQVAPSFLPPLTDRHWKSTDTYRVAAQGPGVLVFAAEGSSRADSQKSTPVITHRSRVVLHPVYDDLTVEVTIADYEKWLPRGVIADVSKPGSQLTVRAALVRTGQPGTDPVEAKVFRFELVDASREPGICMNWPLLGADGDAPPDKDPKPDLRFGEAAGARLTKENLTAELKPAKDKAGRESAEARVESYDFGGSAELRVTCVMADGREIIGTLKAAGAELAAIPLPHRRTGSRIARVWEERQKLNGDDSEDRDPEPVGDGNVGDGFSNYEEYRGFVENREHVRTKPGRKDFFVQNRIGRQALPGLFRLADLTQLAVHYELRPQEMPVSRRMNANRSADSPRTSDEHQHGVILEKIGGSVASMADIEGDYWRPKTTTMVVILSSLLAPENYDELSVTIAHELLHSIGVRHHGEVDANAEWSRGERTVNGVTESWFQERPLEWNGEQFVVDPAKTPQRIRIFLPNGTEIHAKDFPQHLARPRVFWIGRHQGQHSGVVDCVMRYDCSNAYLRPGRPHDRFLSPGEPIGMGLCTASAGTDFNLAGQEKLRYADAARGKCNIQFCVRDDAPNPGAAP